MTTTTDAELVSDGQMGDDGADLEIPSDDTTRDCENHRPTRSRRWTVILAYGILPALAFILAVAAGYAKYVDAVQGAADSARAESRQAASDTAVAMLSYRPDTVENDLDAAKDRLTGPFRDSYSTLVDDVVAPASIQKMITAVATVPASASVTATADHAVVLLFVNQTITVGNDAPSITNSSVRATLDKVDGRWLISGFDPI